MISGRTANKKQVDVRVSDDGVVQVSALGLGIVREIVIGGSDVDLTVDPLDAERVLGPARAIEVIGGPDDAGALGIVGVDGAEVALGANGAPLAPGWYREGLALKALKGSSVSTVVGVRVYW